MFYDSVAVENGDSARTTPVDRTGRPICVGDTVKWGDRTIFTVDEVEACLDRDTSTGMIGEDTLHVALTGIGLGGSTLGRNAVEQSVYTEYWRVPGVVRFPDVVHLTVPGVPTMREAAESRLVVRR